MSTLAIDPDGPGVERQLGKDETGNAYVRRYAKLPRAIPAAHAPAITVRAGRTVMFQKIVHDGLVGQEFLKEHVVTFDLRASTLTFDP